MKNPNVRETFVGVSIAGVHLIHWTTVASHVSQFVDLTIIVKRWKLIISRGIVLIIKTLANLRLMKKFHSSGPIKTIY